MESFPRPTVSTQQPDIREFEQSSTFKNFKVLCQLSCACIPIIEGGYFFDWKILLSDNYDNEERSAELYFYCIRFET